MSVIFADQVLLASGWTSNVRLTVAEGRILSCTPAPPQPGDERHAIVLPAMPNLHSHAFQRAMAGLAEMRGPGEDSFWSWRETMYRFALAITPDQVEAVAAQLYVEMLEAGFSRVGEFHYLHHDRDGRPYADIAEMAARIAAAADATGIGLTLLPVFYAHSGFGGLAPADGQRRFINDISAFAELLDSSRSAVRPLRDAVVGIAPHSLRAVASDELAAIVAMVPMGPIHIHVAEQLREVEDCIAWSGARPVEWLLGNAPVDARWCLIHATHMRADETAAMARSGAVAGLCPITEANLGDGIFPGADFLAAGGRFGIGSDSNVLIGIADELRQLEYSQRLLARQRTVLAPPRSSNGRALFDAALGGGGAALGMHTASIAPGSPANMLSLDAAHPTLAGKTGDAILDAWMFAGAAAIDCVWVNARKLVSGGGHIHRDAIARRFRSVMSDLLRA